MSDDEMQRPGVNSIRPGVMIALVMVIGAAVFIPALSGGWIYDDHPLIADNPYCHSFHWWSRWFSKDFWNVNEEIVHFGMRMVYWRPAVTASYAVDWQLGGGSTLMFHLTNTLAQASVAGLSFIVLRRWIGSLWPAFIASLLFAVHPTKAESVAWIAGRTDVFCMLAIFIATIGIGRRLRGDRWGTALEVVGTVAAYLCKEQAIVLPMFVVVEVWVATGRKAIDWNLVKRIVREVIPQASLAMVYLIFRALFLPIRSLPGRLSGADHAIAVFETIGRFLSLTFAPRDLSIQQGLVQATNHEVVHSWPYAATGLIGLLSLICIALWARTKQPIVTIGIAFFFVTLAPTSNLVYTGMPTLVSERFLYLPVLGLTLLVPAIFAQLPHRWLRVGYGLSLAAIVAAGLISARRAADYSDEVTFWDRELALHPDSREALQFRITHATVEKRYERALVDLLELKRSMDPYKGYRLSGVDLGFQVADILSRITPDHDQASLRAIDRFCAAILDGKAEFAELDVRGVKLKIGTSGKLYVAQLEPFASRYWSVRANLATRLGDHPAALAAIREARNICADCVTIVETDAIVLAAAGRIEDGLAEIDRVEATAPDRRLHVTREHLEKARAFRDRSLSATGPQRLQQRASELAALELWGAAYDVLAPYKAEIEQVPDFAVGFAELAFRAGEEQIAREVLSHHVSSDQIAPMLEDWSAKMGWRS